VIGRIAYFAKELILLAYITRDSSSFQNLHIYLVILYICNCSIEIHLQQGNRWKRGKLPKCL